MDDMIPAFVIETRENLQSLDDDLLVFEKDPKNLEVLTNIFRTFHTVKGTCGFLDLSNLEGLAHVAETLLGLFREGKMLADEHSVSLIFKTLDRIGKVINYIEEHGSEEKKPHTDLIKELEAVIKGEKVSVEKVVKEALQQEKSVEKKVEKNNAVQEMPRVLEKAEEGELAQDKKNMDANKKKVEDMRTIRVNLGLIDNLMNLTSELVIGQNQLLQLMRNHEGTELKTTLQHLSMIISEINEKVMKTRMQPIKSTWSKIPRIIRDLSLVTNKKVRLDMIGEDTELDRQVLENIEAPLTHMIRNSIDHGILTPDKRLARGKPAEGVITLKAFHEGGHVVIEVHDDGEGVNVKRVRQKIVENKLLSVYDADQLTHGQVIDYIFHAGLSTAEHVTELSGRGVGMDVVRTNVDKIGGSVTVYSEEGKGSKFSFKIPLTLAIIPGLIVRAGGEKFTLPQVAATELVRLTARSVNTADRISEGLFLRLRSNLLPLIILSQVLKLENKTEEVLNDFINYYRLRKFDPDSSVTTQLRCVDPSKEAIFQDILKRVYTKEISVVILRSNTLTFGLIVDQILDMEEIAVKPVSPILQNISFFSGNTILGDRSISMILDPNVIAQTLGDIPLSEDKEDKALAEREEKTSLLLFKDGVSKNKRAVLVSLILRIEEMKLEKLEYSLGHLVAHYRKSLIRLMPYNSAFNLQQEGKSVPVLIFQYEEDIVGVIIEKVVDIIDQKIELEIESDQSDVVGSLIIQGEVVDLINVGYFLERLIPSYKEYIHSTVSTPAKISDIALEVREDKANVRQKVLGRVLFADNVGSFKTLIDPLLKGENYAVQFFKSAESLTLHVAEMDPSEEDVPKVIFFTAKLLNKKNIDSVKDLKNLPYLKNVSFVALYENEIDLNANVIMAFDTYIEKFDTDKILKHLDVFVSA